MAPWVHPWGRCRAARRCDRCGSFGCAERNPERRTKNSRPQREEKSSKEDFSNEQAIKESTKVQQLWKGRPLRDHLPLCKEKRARTRPASKEKRQNQRGEILEKDRRDDYGPQACRRPRSRTSTRTRRTRIYFQPTGSSRNHGRTRRGRRPPRGVHVIPTRL